jgi:ABC-type maltose transport system permease subunit
MSERRNDGPSYEGRWYGTLVRTPLALLVSAFALFPVVWIVSAAFSGSNTLVNQSLIPEQASFVNFERLLTDDEHPFALWMWNSIKIAGLSTIIVVGLTALAAYSFSRFRYRGKRAVLTSLLVAQLFPAVRSASTCG